MKPAFGNLWSCLICALLLAGVCNGDSKYAAQNSLGGRWYGADSSYNPDTIAWLGVKYGHAGRFERAIVAQHTGEHAALTYGPSCLQSPAFLDQQHNSTVDEHCLYLNVYAPKSSFGASKRLPVVVYIHGGAFTFGSGSTKILNPHMYTKHDVVLVSINYRLNLLGFIALPNLEHTNFGLLDQRVALEWVRENIEAFGGDPNQVTLIGDSAGGISILHQMTSPLQMKDPLFHRAIVISAGLFAGPELTMEKARQQYTKVAAERLGCSGSPASVISCLKALPLAAVRVITTRFPTPFISTYPMSLRTTGAPINDGLFYPDLIDSLFHGNFDRNMPVIIGSDLDEGSMFAAAAFPIIYPDDDLFLSIVNKLFGDKAPQVLERYGPQKLGNARKATNELTSHLFTSHGTCQAARLISSFTNSVVYRYGNYHVFRHPSNAPMGVFHTAAHAIFLRPAESGLLFPAKYDEEELAMSDHFGRLLMQFAHGKPFLPSEWPAFNTEAHAELHIGPNNSSQLAVGANFQKDDCDFWSALYPPHGLLPPMFDGDLYEHESWHAWIANEGFWLLAAYLRYVKLGALLFIIVTTLVGLYCCCKPRRSAVAQEKKDKKEKTD